MKRTMLGSLGLVSMLCGGCVDAIYWGLTGVALVGDLVDRPDRAACTDPGAAKRTDGTAYRPTPNQPVKD